MVRGQKHKEFYYEESSAGRCRHRHDRHYVRMRFPAHSAGANNNKIWYQTFFGFSIESAVLGDGIMVNQ